jgi:hypothetical protein
MPRKGHSEEQIIAALKQYESGDKVAEICFGILVRRPVAKTAVGPLAIVLISPRCDLLSGID